MTPACLLAMGEAGKRLTCFSGDYGHWDGVLHDCVKDAAEVADYDREHLGSAWRQSHSPSMSDRLRQSLPAKYGPASSLNSIADYYHLWSPVLAIFVRGLTLINASLPISLFPKSFWSLTKR